MNRTFSTNVIGCLANGSSTIAGVADVVEMADVWVAGAVCGVDARLVLRT